MAPPLQTSWTATRACWTGGRATRFSIFQKLFIALSRYYRQHCTLDFGSYTKDLSAICADLSSVFILDNSPGAYRAYPGKPDWCTCLASALLSNSASADNAIPIKSWFNDPSDTALLNLLPVLDALRWREIKINPLLLFVWVMILTSWHHHGSVFFLRFTSDVRSILNRNREAQRQWYVRNILGYWCDKPNFRTPGTWVGKQLMPTTTSSSQPRLFSSWSILWTSSGSKNRFWTETSRSRIHYPRRYSRRFKIPYKENLASARPDGPVIKVVSGVLRHPKCPLLANHLLKKCPAVLSSHGHIWEPCLAELTISKICNGDGARSALWFC